MNGEAYELEELLVTLRRYGVTSYSKGDLKLELDPRWTYEPEEKTAVPDVSPSILDTPNIKQEQEINPATGMTKAEEAELFYSSGG